MLLRGGSQPFSETLSVFQGCHREEDKKPEPRNGYALQVPLFGSVRKKRLLLPDTRQTTSTTESHQHQESGGNRNMAGEKMLPYGR
jgi:hypothetical protein